MTLLSPLTSLDFSINPFLSSNDYSHSPGASHAHSDPLILSKIPLCPQAITPVLISAFYVHSDSSSLSAPILPLLVCLVPFLIHSCCSAAASIAAHLCTQMSSWATAWRYGLCCR
ncbi:unnamed protein product [Pipistrellus nathusii]|uniref:Uncharacterized protein n=1 Tax=Pipistrellus nathusii TaxID=59473 RepID=A0ABN9ZG80_PIPNA